MPVATAGALLGLLGPAVTACSGTSANEARVRDGGKDGKAGTGPFEGQGGGGENGGDGEPEGPACYAVTGFEAAPEPYKVPAARCQATFDAFGKSSPLAYAALDLTGSDAPDLVLFQDTCDKTVGKTHWDVYPGGPLGTGFDAVPRAYTLPAARCNDPFDAAASSSSNLRYQLFDLTGDGRSDLLVTKDTCDKPVGETHWDVYAAGEDGFAPTPGTFTVPAARCRVNFDNTSGTSPLAYVVMDLDGDKFPDLVVTTDACDTTVGKTHWDVYPGSREGFAPTPEAYGLPAARCRSNFDNVGKYSPVAYSLLDMTADGRPDLVVTGDTCDATVGKTHWDVYAGGSDAFVAAPAPYGLPAARCRETFDTLGGTGAVAYSLLDLGCDKRPDIVVTSDTCDKRVGRDHWDVYAGGTDGFVQAPTFLGLPAGRCQATFNALGAYSPVSFAFTGLGGGGGRGLVVTSDNCDDDLGKVRWDVYRAR